MAFAQAVKNKICVLLLEKAWAKINGSYNITWGGFSREVYEHFFGMGTFYVHLDYLSNEEDLNEIKLEIIKKILNKDKTKRLMTCSFKTNTSGLFVTHMYTIISFEPIETKDG